MRPKVKELVLMLTICMGTVAANGQGQNTMTGPPVHGGPPGPASNPVQQAMADQMAAYRGLKITFEKKSAEWTPAKLAPLPHKTITVFNEHAKANQTYSGVPLIDLLTPLGVPDKPHSKEFLLYLVAMGSDGYKVVYSLGEITPDVHDATVLVADSQDGKPIADDGPLKLVATGEKRSARWVRNLVAIRVLKAD